MRKLDYVAPATTRRDAQRRRGKALMLLGYLPTLLLVAVPMCYFCYFIWLFLSTPLLGDW